MSGWSSALPKPSPDSGEGHHLLIFEHLSGRGLNFHFFILSFFHLKESTTYWKGGFIYFTYRSLGSKNAFLFTAVKVKPVFTELLDLLSDMCRGGTVDTLVGEC